MRSGVINVLIFAAGAGVGSLATYFIVRKHFADIADAEIEDVKAWAKEAVNKKTSQLTKALEESSVMDSSDPEQCNKMVRQYAEFLHSLGYEVLEPDAEEEMSDVNPSEEESGMEIISEEEFTDYHEDYDKIAITYYAADDTFVGSDETILDKNEALNSFGNLYEYVDVTKIGPETESIFVRNHDLNSDYEIMLMPGAYVES